MFSTVNDILLALRIRRSAYVKEVSTAVIERQTCQVAETATDLTACQAIAVSETSRSTRTCEYVGLCKCECTSPPADSQSSKSWQNKINDYANNYYTEVDQNSVSLEVLRIMKLYCCLSASQRSVIQAIVRNITFPCMRIGITIIGLLFVYLVSSRSCKRTAAILPRTTICSFRDLVV